MGAIQVRECRTAEEVLSNFREVRARTWALGVPVTQRPIQSTAPNKDVEAPPPAAPDYRKEIEGLAGRIARLEAQIETRNDGDQPERWNSMRQIRRVVCEHYGITPHDLDAKSREAPIRDIRHVAVYLCRMLTIKSFPEIGRMFGGRDHTTALHSVRTVERRVATDIDFAAEIEALKAKIRDAV